MCLVIYHLKQLNQLEHVLGEGDVGHDCMGRWWALVRFLPPVAEGGFDFSSVHGDVFLVNLVTVSH